MNGLEKLELAVDEQLEEVREAMFEGWAKGNDNVEFVAALIRAAYAKGLVDAIVSRKEVIAWAKELGYDLTQPTSPPRFKGFAGHV